MEGRQTLRVAIVHYWLLQMRGGEKVLEALTELFPSVDIFTHVYDGSRLSQGITRHNISTTFIQKLPAARRIYQKYLPLMPIALEELDLQKYDLVVSSESGPAKGVIPRPDALHICYCHSPMRYLWDQYHFYKSRAGPLTRMIMPPLMHRMRQWDVTSAARVDQFVANSRHVAARIEKYYRRDSIVVHPPVDVETFAPQALEPPGDFYLLAGQLVAYKRPDLAIEAFSRTGIPLVVIGEGEERRALQKQAAGNIKFLGSVPVETLKEYLARCRGLIFPGEEDFGIVPVEAMASGRPVIAYGRGGALETVKDGETGLLFHDQTAEALIDAIERFEQVMDMFNSEAIISHARQFDRATFKLKMARLVSDLARERGLGELNLSPLAESRT